MCKSCFLFGHADAPHSILPALEATVERHYFNYGVYHFYIGNRGSFDRLAAAAVMRVKQRHPDIRMYLLLAYHPSERPVDLWGGFDGSYYPPLENTPPSVCYRSGKSVYGGSCRLPYLLCKTHW